MLLEISLDLEKCFCLRYVLLLVTTLMLKHPNCREDATSGYEVLQSAVSIASSPGSPSSRVQFSCVTFEPLQEYSGGRAWAVGCDTICLLPVVGEKNQYIRFSNPAAARNAKHPSTKCANKMEACLIASLWMSIMQFSTVIERHELQTNDSSLASTTYSDVCIQGPRSSLW